MAYTIRNYNSFLRAAKHKHHISHKVAQELYRQVKPQLGRSPKGVDVYKHHKIVKRNIEVAKAKSRDRERQRKRERERRIEIEQDVTGGGGGVIYGEPEYYDEYPDDIWDEWAVTFYYGEDA